MSGQLAVEGCEVVKCHAYSYLSLEVAVKFKLKDSHKLIDRLIE